MAVQQPQTPYVQIIRRALCLLLALAGGMDRMALCSSINYLADSGYLQVRCIEDKAPSSVSDAELEELEVKLTPRGIQLQRCVKKDPLVDM